MSELMNDSRKTIANKTGMMGNTTELINDNAGLINDNAGMINVNREGISEITPSRKKRSRERGPDKNPRKYNQITIRNLKQYQKINFEEKKPIWKKPEFWVAIGGIAVFGFLAWRHYKIRDESRQETLKKKLKN